MAARFALALAAVLVVCGLVALGPFGSGSATSTATSGRTGSASSTTQPYATPSASSFVSQSATPALIPMVPVVAFWSTERSIGRTELVSLLAAGAGNGSMAAFGSVAVDSADLPGLASTLGVTPAASVEALTADGVKAAVRATGNALGVIPASDMTPDVRALAVDGVALFGANRIRDLARWPLLVRGQAAAAFSTAAVWTLAAGGDVMLDRAAYDESIVHRKGVDYPWDGGNAIVDGTTCCGMDGARLALGRQTGSPGAFRALLQQADLAVVNLESPAPNAYSYHPDGLVFTMDPALLAGLRNAGIDAVSLANNHMGNAGAQGVLDTMHNLDSAGIDHAGAGTDAIAARKPAWLAAGGLRIAFLAYDAIRPDYWAAAGRPGTAGLRLSDVTADVRAARSAGADLVIVMPHWGTEYSDETTSDQRGEAAAIVAAGADLILGSHSHWVGPVESISRRQGPAFVVYSLGDLVFQLRHDVRTQEGVVADLTFVGTRLAQVDLRPTLILNGCQPNLLDPGGDGARLLDAVRRASGGLLDW